MIHYDNVTKENIEKIVHVAHKLLMIKKKIVIIGDSGCGKKNALFELIKLQGYYIYGIVDKIHLYVKDPNQSKKECLIKKREKKWS